MNDMPTVAGLHKVTGRLLALVPSSMSTPEQRARSEPRDVHARLRRERLYRLPLRPALRPGDARQVRRRPEEASVSGRLEELARHPVRVEVPIVQAPLDGRVVVVLLLRGDDAREGFRRRQRLVRVQEGDLHRQALHLRGGGHGLEARVARPGEERVLAQPAAQAPGVERADAPAKDRAARRLPGDEERTVGARGRAVSARREKETVVSLRRVSTARSVVARKEREGTDVARDALESAPTRGVAFRERDRVGTRDVPRVVRVPRRGRYRARWAGDVRE